ncbi:hypothetical protein PIB30_023911 [Stylosanthes scabra]|uniref:Uncharacterized protein n=1 Tax=Stylosanthes scabra TaxID=79078 RepID=A0ABU6UBI1_9FABA|nr:hypothetical protein [Stylosanthes scabra]
MQIENPSQPSSNLGEEEIEIVDGTQGSAVFAASQLVSFIYCATESPFQFLPIKRSLVLGIVGGRSMACINMYVSPIPFVRICFPSPPCRLSFRLPNGDDVW